MTDSHQQHQPGEFGQPGMPPQPQPVTPQPQPGMPLQPVPGAQSQPGMPVGAQPCYQPGVQPLPGMPLPPQPGAQSQPGFPPIGVAAASAGQQGAPFGQPERQHVHHSYIWLGSLSTAFMVLVIMFFSGFSAIVGALADGESITRGDLPMLIFIIGGVVLVLSLIHI